MRSYRYAGHAAVLLMAIGMSGYTAASIDASVGSRVGAEDVAASNDGVRLGDVALGRDSTVIKPISIPASPLPDRKPIRYTVRQGDTLDSIEKAFGVTLREITWSNPGLKQPLTPGLLLRLPPVPGVVVLVKAGDSAESIAAAYGVDAATVLGFNDLRATQLTPGAMLVIPIDPTVGPNLSTGVPADPIRPEQLLCPILGASIIQKFGPTSFALEPAFGGYLHFHSGVDLLAGYGTPVDAAAGGKVTAVGYADYFGLRVEITDTYGLVEIYAHMEEADATLGQQVQQGKKIGLVGSTGLSIGAHLHLQLEVGGEPTDPLPLLGC